MLGKQSGPNTQPWQRTNHFSCFSCLSFFFSFLLFATRNSRRWRRALPITSSSSSATPAASSGVFTPWIQSPRSWCVWSGSARGQSPPRRWSPSTNTAPTGSNLAPSHPKPWAWVWTPSPSLDTCGRAGRQDQLLGPAGEQVSPRRQWFRSDTHSYCNCRESCC